MSGAPTQAVYDLATEQLMFLAQCSRALLTSIKRVTCLTLRPTDDYPNLKAVAGLITVSALFPCSLAIAPSYLLKLSMILKSPVR